MRYALGFVFFFSVCDVAVSQTAPSQCELGTLATHAFSVAPQYCDLPACAWICTEGFVRCGFGRTAGNWDSSGALLPTFDAFSTNSSLEQTTGDALDRCAKLPVKGAVLFATVYATFDILTIEDVRFSNRRAAGAAHVIERSSVISNAFPQAHPCWLWMRRAGSQPAGWSMLQDVFQVANITSPIPRPDYIHVNGVDVPTSAAQEDQVLPNFAALDVLLYTGDAKKSLSVQAATFHLAVIQALHLANQTVPLAMTYPTAAWLSTPQAPLPSGFEISMAAVWGVTLLAISLGLFICATQRQVRCVLCGNHGRIIV